MRIKFRHRHPFITGVLAVMITATVLTAFTAITYINQVISDTPKVTARSLSSMSVSNIYDKNGSIIATSSSTNLDYVKIKDVPKTYIDLLLSTEDREFYETKGYSVKGIANAVKSIVLNKVLKKGDVRGGSTIDQQLIKNTVFSSSEADRTIDRKIKEIWLSTQMNKNFTKDQILEWYVNKINLGEHSYGADTISMTYFGKHLIEFKDRTPENISKLAIIAGLGQAPADYNLYTNPKLVKTRRDVVLDSALAAGKITKAELTSAKKVSVTDGLKERYWRSNEINAVNKKYNAYVSATKKQLKSMGYDFENDHIQVYTALDREQDDWLNDKVKEPQYFNSNEQQIAATVVDVKSGYVLAQAGGRNLDSDDEYNRAIQNVRSSGSAIKPFLDYGPAIEYLGWGTNFKLDSSNYVYPGTNTVASNFGGYLYGVVDLKFALRLSLNTPAIRALDAVGPDRAKAFMSGLNMSFDDAQYAGSDALGMNASTEQLAYGFAAIANGGKVTTPQYITKISFADGSEKEVKPVYTQGMKESTAYTLTAALKGVAQTNGSAPLAMIPEFSGMITKTGTVGYDMSLGMPDDASSDTWINGATKDIAVSIWNGYDSPNEPGHYISSSDTSKQLLYADVMRHYASSRDTSDWSQPKTVDLISGSGLTADYVPNDTVVKNVKTIPSADFSNLQEIQKASDEVVMTSYKVDLNKIESVPAGYVDNWLSNLDTSKRSIYDYWTSHNFTELLPLDDAAYLDKQSIYKDK